MSEDERWSNLDDAGATSAERARGRVAWWARAAGSMGLPLVLWWIGSFFLLGNLGKWLDDYGFHLRDPATDAVNVRGFFKTPLPDFWRPLHMIVCQDLITLTWHEFWLAHAACAGMHLLNSVLLFGVLRRLSVRRSVAGVCGVVFLTLPMGYEAIFWPSTFSTQVGLAIFLGLVLPAFLGLSRAEPRKLGALRTWGALVLFALMFAIGCLYEQVLTMAVCMPLFYLAVAPRLSWRTHAARVVAYVAMALAGGVLYAVLLAVTASPGRRGGANTYTPVSELGAKVNLTLHQAWDLVRMRAFIGGAAKTGWEAIGSDWKVGVVVITMLMLSAAAWLAWRWRLVCEESGKGDGERSEAVPRAVSAEWGAVLVIAAGVLIFVCAWLPVVVIRIQWAAPRLTYVPMAAAVIACGGMMELIAILLRRRAALQRGVLMAIGAASIPVCVTGAVGLAGIQWSFRERYRMDQAQLATLRELVPAPANDTVFMPVKLEDWPTRTGAERFDTFARGVWETAWSANYGIRQTYGKRLIYVLPINRWLKAAPLSNVGAESFEYEGERIFATFAVRPDGKTVIPWANVVAFAVDGSGQVRLIERLVLMARGVEVARVALPIVEQAKGRSPDRGVLFIPEMVIEVGS